jgi:hypothetical protein
MGQQTDSPTTTRPGFRLACQLAAHRSWKIGHIDLKTAFLQGHEYGIHRKVVCQLPPEAGHPPYIGARLKKPAYGMNDAPRRWWNRLDASLHAWGFLPTCADRCTYVLYDGWLKRQHRIEVKPGKSAVPLYTASPGAENNGQSYVVEPQSCDQVPVPTGDWLQA